MLKSSGSYMSLAGRYERFLQTGEMMWHQREWNEFIEQVLTLATESENLDEQLFQSYREVICGESVVNRGSKVSNWHFPVKRREDGQRSIAPVPFCYLYRGDFLPCADADGLFWKPSRGVVRVAGKLLRRQHYAEPKNVKLRREVMIVIQIVLYKRSCAREKDDQMLTLAQISFLDPDSQWAFIEYRSSRPGHITYLKDLNHPLGIHFAGLVEIIARRQTHPTSIPSPDQWIRSMEYESSGSEAGGSPTFDPSNVYSIKTEDLFMSGSPSRQDLSQSPSISQVPPSETHMGDIDAGYIDDLWNRFAHTSGWLKDKTDIVPKNFDK